MISKTKTFRGAKFSPAILARAYSTFVSHLDEDKKAYGSQWDVALSRDVGWVFDNQPEFDAEYRNLSIWSATMHQQHHPTESDSAIGSSIFRVNFWGYITPPQTDISVTLGHRAAVEDVFSVFEDSYEDSLSLAPPSTWGSSGAVAKGLHRPWERRRLEKTKRPSSGHSSAAGGRL